MEISNVLQYVAPCVVIIYCYARVSVALRRRARGSLGSRRPTENGTTDVRNRLKLRRKRRTNRMLIAMVAIFAVCWLPLNVILLSLEYDERVIRGRQLRQMWRQLRQQRQLRQRRR